MEDLITMETLIGHRLLVRNMNGTNEEYGYRLYWEDKKEPNIVSPALGLVSSSPFKTERQARIYGFQKWGIHPIRSNW